MIPEIKILGKSELRQEVISHIQRLFSSLNIEQFPQETVDKAIHILQSHNQIVEGLKKPKFIELLRNERNLKGETKLGYVLCVDGRLQSIHFGRTVNIWEEPAGLFDVQLDEEGQLIVASKELRGVLDREAEESREIFEIFFAHTSLKTDHICGYMAANRLKGETDDQLVKRNLREIEEERIPAFTNSFNKARLGHKKETLKQVAVSALFDTDTMGIVLNYGKENQLSTTDLLEKEGFKERIAEAMNNEENSFGFWKDKFTDAKEFLSYYKKVVETTEKIMKDDGIGLNTRLLNYIKENYPDLISSQLQAFMFSLSRRLAFQYLTGLSKLPESGHPDHAFADHKERFATISTSGEGVLDRFNIVEQSFGITSSNIKSAVIQATQVALPLLDKHDDDKENHIIFVSTPLGQGDKIESLREKNRAYFESLYQNDEIKRRIMEGRLLLIPVLVKTTGEIVEILEHIKKG
jgi:hypothetical protein